MVKHRRDLRGTLASLIDYLCTKKAA